MPILYNTKRPHVYGPNGAVSTSNPYGAQAGLEMLKAGGNAADAVVAAGLVACVVEPFHAGLGGGCFVTYYDKASARSTPMTPGVSLLLRPTGICSWMKTGT